MHNTRKNFRAWIKKIRYERSSKFGYEDARDDPERHSNVRQASGRGK